MLTLAVTVVAALVAGRLTGGSWAGLSRLGLTGARWVAVAVALQVAGALLAGLGLPAGPTYAAGLLASVLAVLVFLRANRGVVGLGLVTLGLAANALVVVANGAMPVTLDAAGRAGIATGPLAEDGRHTVAGPDTRLRLLGDVVPAPWPWHGEVLSLGDVLVLAGVAELLVVGMRTQRRPAPAGMTD